MRRSAGILLYRQDEDGLRVLLVHPGGPLWAKRDEGAWSIPKGEYSSDEAASAAALREFAEELGPLPAGDPAPLGEFRQNSSKIVTAFALEGGFDVEALESNPFEMEWPPRSGRMQAFPEVDRAAWLTLDEAHRKIIPGQRPILDSLVRLLAQPL